MPKPVNRPELGDLVKDKISGYEGIVVGVTEWLYGCRRIGLQSRELKDGKPVESLWIDSPQGEVVKSVRESLGPPEEGKPGGPRDDHASARKDPPR